MTAWTVGNRRAGWDFRSILRSQPQGARGGRARGERREWRAQQVASMSHAVVVAACGQ